MALVLLVIVGVAAATEILHAAQPLYPVGDRGASAAFDDQCLSKGFRKVNGPVCDG
jgi:hypothetical protein